jgi:hypothetical protein
MKISWTILGLLWACLLYGQSTKIQPRTTVGFEVDALPYITGGYYASAWIGHNHLRYRAVVSKLNAPDFYVKEGFTNNTIQAYAAIADYFFKRDFEGWWVGFGAEYWNSSIQTDAKLETAHYNNGILTAGCGYVWKFYKNFYLNPWAAGHLRIAGDSKVLVNGKEYDPPLFTPEVSLKLGWHF